MPELGRVLWLLASVACLATPARVCAQPPSSGEEPTDEDELTDEDEDERACAAVVATLPVAAPGAEPDAEVACARFAGRALAARVEVERIDREDGLHVEVRVTLATASGTTSFSLTARRRRYGYERPVLPDGDADVSLRALAGRPGLAVVAVVTRAGEDYYAGEETLIVVDPRGRPRTLWAGPGRYHESEMGICFSLREVTLRVGDGTLRVRSTVSHEVVPFEEGMDAEIHAERASACRSPLRVRADVPLPAP